MESVFQAQKRILAEANVDPDTRVRDLTDDEVKRISAVINDTQVVEGDLRREIALNIKRLKEIGCYRGKNVIDRDFLAVDRKQRLTQEHVKVLRKQ